MNNSIKIGNRLIGKAHQPFVIAEMSGNHNQSLDRALAIVEAAAKAGAHAVKLQTYTADTMTIEADKGRDALQGLFYIDDPKSLWKGRSLYELYKEAYTPWEWHGPIFKRCRELDIIGFSTPFDETAVDFLEGLSVPAYKIASFENNHLPLIKKAAATGKPLIISTGMATVAELDEAVLTARKAGCKDIILLKCTSAYPSVPDDTNLKTIRHLKKLFDVEAGLSDHTLGVGVAAAAVALGATVIEKHFTLSRADHGVDSVFSMEPDELKLLVDETKKAWLALGKVSYGPTERERASLRFRRSVYVVKDVAMGGKFTTENTRIIRPGDGLSPKYYDVIIGKTASRHIKKGTPMNWEMVL
ncbi:MAG: pseudaminic acid synthase [Deltaproteobacteria bacterium]|nr:pseudaminic acid synthase [Deltaproteobacteria bacterium]